MADDTGDYPFDTPADVWKFLADATKAERETLTAYVMDTFYEYVAFDDTPPRWVMEVVADWFERLRHSNDRLEDVIALPSMPPPPSRTAEKQYEVHSFIEHARHQLIRSADERERRSQESAKKERPFTMEELFEDAAEAFKISVKTAERYYYAERRALRTSLVQTPPQS